MATRIIKDEDFVAVLEGRSGGEGSDYYAMYSSVLDGITCNPSLMMIPVDDHVVHRGDGVFESIKCVNGAVFNLGAHLDRLMASASKLRLVVPVTMARLQELIIDAIRAGGHRQCSIRVLLTRGTGNMGINPYDCKQVQLYIIIYKLSLPTMDCHPGGVRLVRSHIPAKASFFAQIKSCNYLPNVLMSMETVDAGADFAAGFTDDGFLTEGATENIVVVRADGVLAAPRLETILAGTTMQLVMRLAGGLVERGVLSDVMYTDISEQDMIDAREILVVGTTRDVTSVVYYEHHRIGDGSLGPIYHALSTLLKAEIQNNQHLLVNVFDERFDCNNEGDCGIDVH